MPEALENWDTIFNAIDQGVAVLDLSHSIVRANRAFADLVGRDTDDIVGVKCYRVLHGTESPPPACPHTRMLEAEGEVRGEYYEASLGRHFQARCSPARDGNGRVCGSIYSLRDITAEKINGEKLAFSESYLRSIIDTEPECVKLLDREGRLIEMNPAGLAMIEADSLEQVAGRPVYGLIAPEFREGFQDLTERVCRGERGNMVFTMIGLKGRRLLLETNAVPFPDATGQQTLLLGVTRDITERREVEGELLKKNKLLGAIANTQKQYIADDAPESVFAEVLSEILSLTDSGYGVFSEAQIAADGARYLKAWAVSGDSRGFRREDLFSASPPAGMEIRGGETLYGEVLERGEAVLADGPPVDGRDPGLPGGPPSLQSFLGIPLFSGDEMVGAIGIANRPGGYNRDLLASLAPLLQMAANFIVAFRSHRLHRLAEEASRKQKELLGSVLRSISNPLYVVDARTYAVTMANPAARDQGIVEGSLCYFSTHNRQTPCQGDHPCPLELIRRKAESVSVEHIHFDKEDEPRPFLVTGYPILDGSGELTHIVEYSIDLSDRLAREEELDRRKAEFEAIFHSMQDAVVFVDTSRRVILTNAAFTEMFGYTAGEVRDRTTEFIYADPEAYENQGRERYNIDALPQKPVYEVQYRHKDGTIFTGETLGVQVRDRAGTIIGFVGVIRDISKRKRLEEQLSQAQKMESVGQMAGGIAHDFNNILAGILGSAELMKLDISEDHPFFEYIETIEKSAQRGASLTSHLLAFSRKSPSTFAPLIINDTIKDTLKLVSQTFDRSIEISSNLPADLPAVKADVSQVSQVLLNLCINARDAMPTGGRLDITTESRMLTREEKEVGLVRENRAYVVLTVSDTGTGIDEETRLRIFDPFFTTKSQGKGTGLGLSMVYGVLKNHDGFIMVSSAPGQGATFRVYLPSISTAEENRPDSVEPPSGRGETILVVDDEVSIRTLAGRALEKYGYRVLTAADGTEAVEMYRSRPGEFALVILDMIMPKKSGLETFREIRGLDPAARVTICSGYAEENKALALLDEGAANYIQKPFQIHQLLAAVRAALD